MQKKPILLIILDGYGYRKESEYNAVAQADTPHLHDWFTEYPHALLQASGPAVGLAEGVMGNSEVGHLTIGTGQIHQQPLMQLNELIATNKLSDNQLLTEAFNTLNNTDNSLHIIGLLSDAGVHAHIDHLIAFIHAARTQNVKHIYVHAILDGRDVPPRSAEQYLDRLQKELDKLDNASLASVHGRHYAMDRDNNWDRIQASVDILIDHTIPKKIAGLNLENFYAQNITDEFVPPTLLSTQGTIKNGDGIIFCNFRPDRARQLTQKLLESVELSFFITPVSYHPDLMTLSLIQKQPVANTLIKTLTDKFKFSTFSIAETEKYAHITYFFNGGRENTYENETRVLIPSIKTDSYAKHPCMSAEKITDQVLASLQDKPCDFYLINYANADMVGHTGDMEVTKKALECLDQELERLYKQVIEQMDGTMYITSDHGNAEIMFDKQTGQPRTSHTTNPVPFIAIQKNNRGEGEILPFTGLKDIAPFIIESIEKKKGS